MPKAYDVIRKVQRGETPRMTLRGEQAVER